jgi:DNA-binding NtrC family response regulator
LIVDDEVEIARMLEEMLTNLGYSVTVRTSPLEALQLFRMKPERFDLLLTDQTMPQLTGDQLIREILSCDPELPAIVMTGFSDIVTKSNFQRTGACELLMKPIGRMDLAQALSKALSGHRLSHSAAKS